MILIRSAANFEPGQLKGFLAIRRQGSMFRGRRVLAALSQRLCIASPGTRHVHLRPCAVMRSPTSIRAGNLLLQVQFRLVHERSGEDRAVQKRSVEEESARVHQSNSESTRVPAFIKPGDWLCGHCQSHNFARRQTCYECQADIKDGRTFYDKDAWFCTRCRLSVISNDHILVTADDRPK